MYQLNYDLDETVAKKYLAILNNANQRDKPEVKAYLQRLYRQGFLGKSGYFPYTIEVQTTVARHFKFVFNKLEKLL
jgi:hypothetical protein